MALTINNYINVQDNHLTNGLIPVFKIIETIQSSSEKEINLDCSFFKFISPVFAISLFLYLRSCEKQCMFKNLSPYLKAIMFDSPLMPDNIGESEFRILLSTYSRKTFIPIVSFPSSVCSAKTKDAIISAIEDLVSRQLKIPMNIVNGLKYMFGEMVDNITEHSNSERGYIFAQAYSTKQFLDICIADEGVTLKESYRKAGIEIMDDLEAMKALSKCISSKNRNVNDSRGYGIKTTKNMLSSGLDGQFMIMSGGAIALKSLTVDNIVKLPNCIKWKGTV